MQKRTEIKYIAHLLQSTHGWNIFTMQAANVEKYLKDDTVFNLINREFVTLKDEDIKENNHYLKSFLESLIAEMKEADATFRAVNPTIFYAGSYYKQTKYGKPEEFDLNIIIRLPPPINYNSIKIVNSRPGFVTIHSGLQQTNIQSNSIENRLLRSILDGDMYINQKKFRQWMEGVLSNTRRHVLSKNAARSPNNGRLISVRPFFWSQQQTSSDEKSFMIGSSKITYSKGGPAFTLAVRNPIGQIISVDLVPILQFTTQLPNPQQNLSKYGLRDWFAVPKPIYENGMESRIREWRLCFYNQEKEILRTNGPIKPVIRQLKKLRDNQGWHVICSYFLEMLSLNYLKTSNQSDLQMLPRSLMFFKLLKSLQISLQEHRLPWYWDSNLNLLERIHPLQLTPINFRLCKIIKSIEGNIVQDKFIIARYVLCEAEMTHLELRLKMNGTGAGEDNKEQSYCSIM